MDYTLTDIARIVSAKQHIVEDNAVGHLLLDSRRIYTSRGVLFFALKGERRDGHQFLAEVYKKGVRNFVISEPAILELFPQANFLLVEDCLVALQTLATYHRKRFFYPVIAITGSNGKTIVKEWLYHFLHPEYNIVRSPKSYNSQIGVPLSIWQMGPEHELGIFEAGISLPGEMEHLQKMIEPSFGILTNIREAHNEGFLTMQEKAVEKSRLFASCTEVVYPKDHLGDEDFDFEKSCRFFNSNTELKFYSWSCKTTAWLSIKLIEKRSSGTLIKGVMDNKEMSIQIPFTDDASIDNAITCWCTLLAMEEKQERIKAGMRTLFPVNMRLELKKGNNHCTIINDSYSADLDSLEIALSFLDRQAAGAQKTVILSDFLQTGHLPERLYDHIYELTRKHAITKFIGIGEQISAQLHKHVLVNGENRVELFPTTEAFIKQFRSTQFRDEVILVKGARVFRFEQIVSLLEQKLHQTILEINLGAVLHNVKEYQKFLQSSTRIMAMVKAFSYGSGGAEIASFLQFHKLDYLAVAYADEGVELRKADVSMPIMVMNPEENAFENIVEYSLEPELFSIEILQSFDDFLKRSGLQQFPVHIEIETGMNRLGFATTDVANLAKRLQHSSMKVQSVFSHLAASEDPDQDEFTRHQFNELKNVITELEEKLGYRFLKHIANSAAIVRHPELQMDMVRLGIGMYGIDTTGNKKLQLQSVATLKSTVAQVKELKKGETVSYNRAGKINKDSVIATIRLGYADGYPRRLGNGVGKVLIRGKQAPVIGTVCMDMIMADVTGIGGVQAGDEVIIFGQQLPVQSLAKWAETIPYEIMTGISQRVKRVFYEE